MKLWLDDIRPIPKDFDIWVKNFQDACDILATGKITHISFDHDLGSKFGYNFHNGYHVACFIEECAFNGTIPKLTWEVHSSNPKGKTDIVLAMNSAERFWDNQYKQKD